MAFVDYSFVDGKIIESQNIAIFSQNQGPAGSLVAKFEYSKLDAETLVVRAYIKADKLFVERQKLQNKDIPDSLNFEKAEWLSGKETSATYKRSTSLFKNYMR